MSNEMTETIDMNEITATTVSDEVVRTAQVLQEDGSFMDINPLELKKGMQFKFFEDGILVAGLYSDLWTANGDAYEDEDGNIALDVHMMGDPDENLIEETEQIVD